jgi:hypothetical protein
LLGRVGSRGLISLLHHLEDFLAHEEIRVMECTEEVLVRERWFHSSKLLQGQHADTGICIAAGSAQGFCRGPACAFILGPCENAEQLDRLGPDRRISIPQGTLQNRRATDLLLGTHDGYVSYRRERTHAAAGQKEHCGGNGRQDPVNRMFHKHLFAQSYLLYNNTGPVMAPERGNRRAMDGGAAPPIL